ncbi:MAG: YncE family protein [Myxococcota bacterium]
MNHPVLAPLAVLAFCGSLALFGCAAGSDFLAPASSTAATSSARSGPILDCVPKGNARPICTFKNPEDMVVLPDNKTLIIGEYGSYAGEHSGSLVLFDLETEQTRSLFRAGSPSSPAVLGWGDPACTSAPSETFNSHGMDLIRRGDGRLALLVVQHGEREAVEFFEVERRAPEYAWELHWRGCVPAPEDASLNEVAALRGGGFYTTKMASLKGALQFEKGMPTEPTGHAFSWSLGEGYQKIPNTEGIMPNGIVVSSDESILYMNASGNNSVRKIDLATGKVLGVAEVASPDNVTWAPDGKRLLVASLKGLDPADFETCLTMTRGACPIPFAIEAVDAATMTPLGPVYESQGAPMGAGTVGLQVGSELFVGSFKGDRILRIQLD